MNRDRGNRDWLNEYMSLKQVNPGNPFTVPEGYFDSLDEQILSKIKLEELKGENFTVPEGYFDELSGNIMSRIAVEEALDKESAGFTVPEGYFESLEQQIQSRIFVEEALGARPAGFDVPEGYFDGLTNNILAKTTNEAKPGSRGIIRRMFSPMTVKYAAAACLVLGIGGTLLLNQSISPEQAHQNSFLHKSLSVIPVADIQNYLESHLDASDTKTLMDESKPADADNLSHDLQNALDSTAQ